MMKSTNNRRRFLLSALGLGGISVNSVLAGTDPISVPHHAPRARRVIFLFMHGGPSQVDTFDYKPQLQKDDGKELPFAPAAMDLVVSQFGVEYAGEQALQHRLVSAMDAVEISYRERDWAQRRTGAVGEQHGTQGIGVKF